ncbi:hypothetical protein GCK72_000734 [Caenorhabditis remanei]|uniref:Uncharacterized protein n=1 Tax=Caenorhabditis remanei TaxID=31234 RepID=A0A6A5HNX0_CAERE|nr:hypothetical protein GCK72_000734 [Caenorhabditis remanei]KAF1768921.1 hypothetical protein GCK72_000734 [Caenorhabditis remanei]
MSDSNSENEASFDFLSDSDHSDGSDVEQQEPEKMENVVESSGEDEVSDDDVDSTGEDEETSESEEDDYYESDSFEDDEESSDDEEETPQNADVKTLLQASEEAALKLLDEKYLTNRESLRAFESVERNTDQEAKKKIEESYRLSLQEYAELRAQQSLTAEPPVTPQAVNQRSGSGQQAPYDVERAIAAVADILQHISKTPEHNQRRRDARTPARDANAMGQDWAIIGAVVVMALLCPFITWYSMEQIYSAMPEKDLRNFKCVEDLPEHLMTKWTPDFSKYQGVEAFAREIGNQDDAKYLYEMHPVLTNMKENQADLQFYIKSENMTDKPIRLTGPCVYKNRHFTVFLKDGFLHVNGEYQANGEMKNATFVYSVSE